MRDVPRPRMMEPNVGSVCVWGSGLRVWGWAGGGRVGGNPPINC